jgi:hypothetical protein
MGGCDYLAGNTQPDAVWRSRAAIAFLAGVPSTAGSQASSGSWSATGWISASRGWPVLRREGRHVATTGSIVDGRPKCAEGSPSRPGGAANI